MVVIQLIRGYRMRLITVHTRTQLMLMQHKHTPIIIIWLNMAVYLGYRNTTDTVRGTFSSDFVRTNSVANSTPTKNNDCQYCRLHHDQQTAHALESAAAYSSYPTMAGKCSHLHIC